MELAHRSLPKGLVFTARIFLGDAVVFIGGFLVFWSDLSDEYTIVGLALVGAIARYILQKHFLWALLIPTVAGIAHILLNPSVYHDVASVEVGRFLSDVAIPLYLGAFVGYLISEVLRRSRLQ